MMMLGGVPIMVIMPPRILAKAKGMRSIPGGRARSAAVRSATGSIRARAPTLFMKAEQTITTVESEKMWPDSLLVKGRMLRAMISTTPALRRARLITSTAPTVRTAG